MRILRLGVSEIATRHLDQNLHILGEESTNDHISSDEGSKPVNDFKEGPTLHPADTNAAAEEIDPELAVNLNMEKAAAIFEDVGLPEDDQWDLIAAHEYRFCSQHGEVEWLLEYADRWMHSSDFGSEWAETALEAGLQKYQSRHNGDNMSPRSAQADCVDGLWSQVDTPIQKGVFDGKAVYLVRWKLRWTSERDIDNDNGWVQASFQSQNERRNRRRSPRAELAPTDVTRKIEGMMRVINIEDLL